MTFDFLSLAMRHSWDRRPIRCVTYILSALRERLRRISDPLPCISRDLNRNTQGKKTRNALHILIAYSAFSLETSARHLKKQGKKESLYEPFRIFLTSFRSQDADWKTPYAAKWPRLCRFTSAQVSAFLYRVFFPVCNASMYWLMQVTEVGKNETQFCCFGKRRAPKAAPIPYPRQQRTHAYRNYYFFLVTKKQTFTNPFC